MISVDLTGRVLGGRYRIERRLGAGGMGVVYEGLQLDLGRRVAIKVLEEIDDESLGRFRDEAMLAASLVHPNVVGVNDLGGGENGEPPFIVMELLEGLSLADLLAREGKLPLARAQSIASQILSALEAAHGARIIHRDIKPSNIWVTSVDDRDHVKVLDFGIARMIDDTRRRTHTGSFIGTPSYMAPEVVLGADASVRSDIFAVGVVIYRMLSGAAPFKQNESAALVTPPDLRRNAPEVPASIADVVMRSLARHPEDRPASARELRAALKTTAPRAPTPERERSRTPFVAALGTTLALGAAAIVFVATRPPALHALSPFTGPSLAVDASAPPIVDEVDADTPATTTTTATADAAVRVRQCLCKDEYGTVLCAKRGKARCECYTDPPDRSILCETNGAVCTSFTREVVGFDGDACRGWTYGTNPRIDPPAASSHPLDERAGKLWGCNQCPVPEWRQGTQGAKCTGIGGRAHETTPGTLFCK